MAYTDPVLDETIPPSTEKVKLGASRIRELTRALRERLASIFVNPDADPLVVKDKSLELAMLSDAARLGLYKGEIILYSDPALIVPAASGGGAVLLVPHSVDQLAMFIFIKTTDQLTAALNDLHINAYGVGAVININYFNRDPALVLDLRNTVFGIMVLTPVP
jgi:hypothetical protein